MIAVLDHSREIVGDAGHAACANGLDAGLLHGIENGARCLVLRRQSPVQARIVAGEPQRHRIGVATHDGHVGKGQLARRLRQPRLAACDAGPLGG